MPKAILIAYDDFSYAAMLKSENSTQRSQSFTEGAIVKFVALTPRFI